MDPIVHVADVDQQLFLANRSFAAFGRTRTKCDVVFFFVTVGCVVCVCLR